MKRIICLLLCVLCLSLCACGKSDAVKHLEDMIKGFPQEITPADFDAVEAAQAAYDALSAEEQESVKNQQTLKEALDRCYELALIGNWCNAYIDFWNVEGMYERLDLTLYEDMSFVMYHNVPQSGTWFVAEKSLALTFNDGSYMLFGIQKNGDSYTLTCDNNRYLHTQNFYSLLDEMFLTVTLTDENVSDYCEPYLQTVELTDAFGEATGHSKTYAMLGSKAYQDGWLCFNGKDIAIEVLFPAQQITHAFTGGDDGHRTEDAHTTTMQFDIPFAEVLEEIGSVSTRGSSASDLTAESLTFGRAKGTLYFINLDYVADTPYVDNCNRAITLTDGSELPYAAWNEDIWNEEHPY